jgi:glycine betaine catabolism B
VNFTLRLLCQQHETENARSFLFQPDPRIEYQAGQYLRYTLSHPDADDRGMSRSFTIASAPAEPLMLTTRLSSPPSSFKRALAALSPGDVLEATGPQGQFVYPQADPRAVFIAGGIGITPFRSILGDIAARNGQAKITLLYSNRTPEMLFRQYLDNLAVGWPDLEVVYLVTQPTSEWNGRVGRIDAAALREYVPDLATTMFYVSGPTGMVQSMRMILDEVGVEPGRVKHEVFPGYDR